MDIYILIKMLHVGCVIAWVGGDFACLVLSMRDQRQGDMAALLRLLPDIMFVTRFIAVPASLIALACGLVMVVLAWDFSQLWVLIGLAGFATVFVSGVAFLKPKTERVMKEAREGRVTATTAMRLDEILRFVKLDHLVMFLVVADMVLKPGWGDHAVWASMLAVLIVGTASIAMMPAGFARAAPGR